MFNVELNQEKVFMSVLLIVKKFSVGNFTMHVLKISWNAGPYGYVFWTLLNIYDGAFLWK